MKTGTRQPSECKFNRSTSFITVALLMISLIGCRTLLSKAKGQASNLKCDSDVGFVKGELDAGVKITVSVKNVGEAGFITIRPELSTSEGDWSRSQELHFDAGESKTLSYFFDEPTINAMRDTASVQCRVGISPQAD
ncbi:MAG TPA: hypothetical protein VD861_07120 [Pyrinomonadaceae bacterium]|nr:hypothetical protein [Pyrinomonadaceae bacterium]